MKARKPRVTKSRLKDARSYCQLSQMAILFVKHLNEENMSELGKIILEFTETHPNIFKGAEYINDLLEWEEDRINSRKKD